MQRMAIHYENSKLSYKKMDTNKWSTKTQKLINQNKLKEIIG